MEHPVPRTSLLMIKTVPRLARRGIYPLETLPTALNERSIIKWQVTLLGTMKFTGSIRTSRTVLYARITSFS